ncbi:hypothetical protein CALCODRAFT_25175 [Calocera cornea HHB12733]|uniref:Uncharacterized protein n=1 Tax=Calocera cornea HHB12733 TaxID=1353952 RepID=A0A165J2C4_9BASI|nr:hypothetical protein CALCODRAFT_25175 [Calocera cornea HHB12733]
MHLFTLTALRRSLRSPGPLPQPPHSYSPRPRFALLFSIFPLFRCACLTAMIRRLSGIPVGGATGMRSLSLSPREPEASAPRIVMRGPRGGPLVSPSAGGGRTPRPATCAARLRLEGREPGAEKGDSRRRLRTFDSSSTLAAFRRSLRWSSLPGP